LMWSFLSRDEADKLFNPRATRNILVALGLKSLSASSLLKKDHINVGSRLLRCGDHWGGAVAAVAHVTHRHII